MVRNFNRVLSATPTLLIALLGLYAAADPVGANQKFGMISIALRTDQRLVWAMGAIIAVYLLLWWLSSIDPPPKRHRVVRHLQSYYAMTSAHIKAVQSAGTDDEAKSPIRNYYE